MGGPYQKNINVSLEIIFGKVDMQVFGKNARYLLKFMILVLPFVKLFKHKATYKKKGFIKNRPCLTKIQIGNPNSKQVRPNTAHIPTNELCISQAHNNSKNISWGFISFPRLPEKSNFALGNSFFMSHVISIGLVRTCNLQVIASHRKNIFELNGNANSLTFVPIRNYLYCIF